MPRMLVRYIMIQLVTLIPVYTFSNPNEKNLLKIEDISRIKAQDGLTVSCVNGGDLLIRSSGAPTRTPAVYFGTIKVVPGESYTYVIRGKARAHNEAVLYVFTEKGNLVWPGSKLGSGVAQSTFTIPADASEITVGIVFNYPSPDDYVLVKGVGLFSGHVAAPTWIDSKEKQFSHLAQGADRHSSNLIEAKDISLRLEKGVDFSYELYDGSPFLIVRSTGTNDVSPAIRFTTVKVEPGRTYTYIVKARTISPCRMSLYVFSKDRNLVWPGSEINNGIGHNVFQVPDDVTEITLAMAFVYPKNNEYLLIQDIGLFLGSADPDILNFEESDDFGMSSLIASQSKKNNAWKNYAMWILLLLPFILFAVYRKIEKRKHSALSTFL
jgi:hypothetical protein